MNRPYRAPNKRIIHRTGSGKFRRSTLADIGMGCCEKCGAIFTPNYESARENGFVDPFKFRAVQKLCPECNGTGRTVEEAHR